MPYSVQESVLLRLGLKMAHLNSPGKCRTTLFKETVMTITKQP